MWITAWQDVCGEETRPAVTPEATVDEELADDGGVKVVSVGDVAVIVDLTVEGPPPAVADRWATPGPTAANAMLATPSSPSDPAKAAKPRRGTSCGRPPPELSRRHTRPSAPRRIGCSTNRH